MTLDLGILRVRHVFAGGLIFLWLMVLQAAVVFAQDTSAPVPAPIEPTATEDGDRVFSAPVTLDGEALFQVRGFSALPADERAAKVEERLIALAETGAKQIVFAQEETEFGIAFLANGRMLTVTTSADAQMEQIDIDLLAAAHAEAIEQAILAYRANRSDEARVDSAMVAAGWTAGFLFLTLIFRRMRKKIGEGVENLVVGRFAEMGEATQSVVRGKAIGRLVGFGVNLALWVFYLFVFYYYLSFVLLSFAETRSIAQALLDYVSQPLIDILMGFVAYLPNLITLLIIVIVTRFLVRGLRLLMDNIEAGNFAWEGFEPHWLAPTFILMRALIILIATVFAFPYIPGSDSRAFQGLTILAGIMLSLGSNTVVSNMMAGLFVIYRRSTNLGDRIKVGDQLGDVVEIKLMETLIKSTKNEMISIPNAQLLNSEVVNYSRKIDGRGLVAHTTVGIGYEEPKEKVEAMLIEAAGRTDRLKQKPEPFVLLTGLGDFAISYQINAFTTRGARLPLILSDLHRNIVDVFNENGVQIMTPAYEGDPPDPKIAPLEWPGELAKALPRKA